MMQMRCNRRYTSLARPLSRPDFEPEFHLTHFGKFDSMGGFEYEQVSPGFALHAVWSGHGIMRTEDRDWEVGPGDVFLFFPGMHIHYYDHPDTPWQYYWTGLDGRRAAVLLPRCGLTSRQPMRTGAAWSLKPTLDDLSRQLDQQQTTPYTGTVTAWRLLELLIRVGETVATNTDWAERARTHIDACQHALPSAGELADLFGIDRSTLYRAFVRRYGMPVKTYIDRVRLDRAATLLDHSPTPVTRIAVICGYREPQYFIRAFRQRFGLTPGQWRNRPTG